MLNSVGTWGKYQKRQFVLMLLISCVPGSIVISNVFIFATPLHRCCLKNLPNFDDKTCSSANFNLNNDMAKTHGAFPNETLLDGSVSTSQCTRYKTIPHNQFSSSSSPFRRYSSSSRSKGLKDGIVSCNGTYVWDENFYHDTLTKELQLVCESSWYTTLQNMCYFVGVGLGGLVFGTISDKFGRRTSMLSAGCLLFTLVSACSLVVNATADTKWMFWVIAALRTVAGIGVQGCFQTCFVYCVEIVSEKQRVFTGVNQQLVFAIGEMYAAILAYILRDSWRLYNFINVLPLLPLLIVAYWFMPESVLWLLSTKKFEEAEKLLEHIAKTNGKPKPDKRQFDELVEELNDDAPRVEMGTIENGNTASNGHATSSTTSGKIVDSSTKRFTSPSKPDKDQVRPIDIFIAPGIWNYYWIQAGCWFVTSLVYYGISLNLANIGGNPYVVSLLISLVELPANALVIPAMPRFGRRATNSVTFLLAGLCVLLITIVPTGMQWLSILLAVSGKFMITAAFACVYFYGSELFPTKVRTFAVGMCSVCSRLGAIAGSPVGSLGAIWHPLPFFVFAAGGFIAGLLTLLLPETTGYPLPETLDDSRNLRKGNLIADIPIIKERRRNAEMKAEVARANISQNGIATKVVVDDEKNDQNNSNKNDDNDAPNSKTSTHDKNTQTE